MRTLQSVIDDVREADQDKWDAFVTTDQLRLEDGLLGFPALTGSSHFSRLKPNDWAIGQLCQQLGIPASYFKRCPAELQDRQFNYWLKLFNERRNTPDCDGQATWLLRAKGTALRAVLSDRYGRLDNAALTSALVRVISESFVVQSVEITDVSFHIRLLKPMSKRLVRPGDEVCAGLHIANSEVGMRSVTVDSLVFRLVCSNGLIRLVKGRSLFYRRHVGDGAIAALERLPEAIEGALIGAEQSMDALAATVDQRIDDPAKHVWDLARREGLPEDLAITILDRLGSDEPALQHTLYGLVNAMTSAGQTLGPDERYSIEVLAGQMLAA